MGTRTILIVVAIFGAALFAGAFVGLKFGLGGKGPRPVGHRTSTAWPTPSPTTLRSTTAYAPPNTTQAATPKTSTTTQTSTTVKTSTTTRKINTTTQEKTTRTTTLTPTTPEKTTRTTTLTPTTPEKTTRTTTVTPTTPEKTTHTTTGTPTPREKTTTVTPTTPEKTNRTTTEAPTPSKTIPTTEAITSPYYEPKYRKYKSAAVATDTILCSQIATDILENKKGSAVDAAIAASFCAGVVNAHSTGLGGGHFMTIYARPKGSEELVLKTLMSREWAPLKGTEDMYINKTGASVKGGLAIGVPGEMMGLYTAWQEFGILAWDEVIQPAIDLCNDGFEVEEEMAFAANYVENDLRTFNSELAATFVKEDGSLIQKGDILKRPKYGATLERIRDDPETFYKGSLAEDVAADIQDNGGIVSVEDLASYTSKFKEPMQVSLDHGDYTLCNPPPPSSGVVIDYIMNILDGYNFSRVDMEESEALTYQRIVEAFKFAFAKRSALGDSDFANITEILGNMTSDIFAENTRLKINDTHTQDVWYYEPAFENENALGGTTHISVLAEDGTAVAMTTTINTFFGSMVKGSRTGIIFNNEMDDFSTPGTKNFYGIPASPSNFIEPGKMPMSSMSPTIILNKEGKVVYVSGSSGGPRIITSTAFVALQSLWFDLNLGDATRTPRVHHQLMPDHIKYETAFDMDLLKTLEDKGHKTEYYPLHIGSVCTVHNRCLDEMNKDESENCIHAASDGRKRGAPHGY